MDNIIFFNGKPLSALSLVELRELEAATIEAIIIHEDKRIETNKKLVDVPFNTSLLFDKQVIENNIKTRENQLTVIKRQLDVRMSNTWI